MVEVLTAVYLLPGKMSGFDADALNYLSANEASLEFNKFPPLVQIDSNRVSPELCVLGSGKFGVVHKVLLDGVIPIAKKYLMLADKTDIDYVIMKREAYVMKEYNNISGVIHSLGVDNKDQPTIVYMECGEGTLKDVIYWKELAPGAKRDFFCSRFGNITVKDKVNILLQLCHTFATLHSLGIIHRDIKASNIIVVVDTNGQISFKVTDFGLARSGLFGHSAGVTPRGTHAYMAPELLMHSGQYQYSEQTDMYAFAILMNEFLTEKLPLNIHVQQLIGKMYQTDGKERPPIYDGPHASVLVDEIKKRWNTKVADRGTFQELHQFLQSAVQQCA